MSVVPGARSLGLSGDPVMNRLRAEAEDAALKEPELAGFLIANVLNQESFEAAVAHRVSSRLDHSDMPSGLIRQTFHEAISHDGAIGEGFRADLLAVADRDPACDRLIEPLLYFKGFHALQAHRLAHWLLERGRRDFALYLQSRISAVFGVDLEQHGHIGRQNSYGTMGATSRPGVFVCGAATGPETIDDSIAQANSAALAAFGVVNGSGLLQAAE